MPATAANQCPLMPLTAWALPPTRRHARLSRAAKILTHKLRRDLWRPFDPARTTQVVLVEFPPDWSAESSTSFDQTTITIRHENVRLYLIEVPEFNEILAEQREQAEDEKWAFIILDDYWLTKHQKHPQPREAEAPEEAA